MVHLLHAGSLKYREAQAVGCGKQVVGAVLTHLPGGCLPGATAASQKAPAEGSAFRYWIISFGIAFEMEGGFILWIW